MNLIHLLEPDRVVCDRETASKKRLLELASETLAKGSPDLTTAQIFDSLLGREKLGSTGLGHGVALPHGRSKIVQEPRLAVVRLSQGIDYDAPDSEPVDLIFALIVPEESTEEHLQILAMLAEMLANESFVTRLRTASNCQSLFSLLTDWKASNAA
jgi:PTS system nitrogen regulatory IIA component